jgi:hypothetical protein
VDYSVEKTKSPLNQKLRCFGFLLLYYYSYNFPILKFGIFEEKNAFFNYDPLGIRVLKNSTTNIAEKLLI